MKKKYVEKQTKKINLMRSKKNQSIKKKNQTTNDLINRLKMLKQYRKKMILIKFE